MREAAFLMGLHWRTLYRWTLEGSIKYIQESINAPVYIPQSEIERVLTEKRNQPNFNPVVYFIQGEDGGLIKIGTTNNLKIRFLNLQNSSPVKLKLLASANIFEYYSEIQMHEKFAKHRRHGEWFEPVPELLDFIKKLNAKK